MARLPRLSLAGVPHHIIQRGNNGQAIFSADDDYRFWLELALEYSRSFGVAIHAYVLMVNHVHLLATPQSANGMPQLMQAIGRRYVRYFNTSQQRSGTLWEGRYRSNVLQAENYLLPCMAYLDLNPVRAGCCDNAAAYPWSSHGHYIGRRVEKVITPHALFWAMGNTPFAREEAYAQLVRDGLSAAHVAQLSDAALKGWALGDMGFMAELQKSTDRRLSKSKPGRPPNTPPFFNRLLA